MRVISYTRVRGEECEVSGGRQRAREGETRRHSAELRVEKGQAQDLISWEHKTTRWRGSSEVSNETMCVRAFQSEKCLIN